MRSLLFVAGAALLLGAAPTATVHVSNNLVNDESVMVRFPGQFGFKAYTVAPRRGFDIPAPLEIPTTVEVLAITPDGKVSCGKITVSKAPPHYLKLVIMPGRGRQICQIFTEAR
jgi:hypothetical protein